VPDLDAVLMEIRRVLQGDGRLIAATNSDQGLPQLNQLLDAVAAQFQFRLEHATSFNRQFNLENGADFLAPHFAHVELREVANQLVFPAPEPILAYVQSMDEWYRAFFPAELRWEEFMTAVRRRLETHFQQHSRFHVDKKAGFFFCSQLVN
jgi:SAM-dependent methyltransferase